MITEMDDGSLLLTGADKQEYLDNIRLNEKKRDDIFNTKKAKLKEYLISIDPEKADDALKALVQIASEHKSAKLTVYNEEDGRYERVKRSSVEKAMKELQPLLTNLRDKLKSIPISDMALFNLKIREIHKKNIDYSLEPDEFEVSTVSFINFIKEAFEATEGVIQEINNHAEYSIDTHRTVLASNVALVIKNILKKNVATTPHTNLSIGHKPTTALYSQLLNMTLKLADEPSVDMQKLMAAGIELSKDSTLPHLIK